MTDDIVTRLRFALEFYRDESQPVLLEDAADEIERLREKLELAAQMKQFVSLWWDDPLLTAEICEAWDNLPEEVRMWVLDD